MNARIGVDLGGTKIEGIVLTPDGAIAARERVATPAYDYALICRAVDALVRKLEQHSAGRCSVGIGIPGIVSPATGLVKNANTVTLIGQPFAEDMRKMLGREVRIENDANCLLLSEVHGGAAAGCVSAFAVIIGTGTGGALYANGALISGANAIAGEWGHNPVPWTVSADKARNCYCGKANCVETFLSGPGLVRSYLERGTTPLRSVEEVLDAGAGGDRQARATLDEYANQLGDCAVSVVNIFDPAVIVLGGGVSNLPGLAARVEARIANRAFSDSVVTRVLNARFGDSSGVIGAARLWPAGEQGDV